MYHFTVEDFQAVDQCQKCCCERLNLKPGTTTRISVGYAPWAVPIGQLHCAPLFELEQLQTCPTQPSGPEANVDPISYDATLNTPVNIDLALVIQPAPLTFKVMPLYGPLHGKVQPLVAGVNDGKLTYTPAMNYTGPDRFFVTATDASSQSKVFEVLIGVGISGDTVAPTPHVSVGKAVVDTRLYSVSFPVTISPVTQSCEIWKLTVLQAALDCDCTCYTRTDCFDIGVAKC
jgi:hypothetical protein